MRRFRIEHVSRAFRGSKIRTIVRGKHRLRIAFPKGPKKKGSGKLIEVLHPANENPARCNPAELLILGNPARKNPAELLVLGNPSEKRHSNSASSASGLYEEFHQMPARGVIEQDETQDMPRHTTVLGDLIALGLGDRSVDGRVLEGQELADNWRKCSHISFGGKDVKLAADPNGGNQLYFVGDGQALSQGDLFAMAATRRGGRWLIGPAFFIVYDTRKMDDGGGFDQYTHKFGDEGGRRPTLYYDAKIEHLLLRGGSYHVEGAGIVN